MKRNFCAVVAAILILCLVGCSPSAIDILNLAVGALEIALPLIGPAAGVDPGTIAAVQTYLGATSQAITQASDILAGPGTDAQKAAAIAQAFANIVAPLVPVKYQALAAAVEQVAQYIAQFLAKTASMARSETSHQVSPADTQRLGTIKARAGAVHLKVVR